MFSRSRGPWTWLLLAVLGAGCEAPLETEPEREQRDVPAGVVVISAEARDRGGVEVQTASKTRRQACLEATGWLAARPGGEVVLKAPASGFLVLEPAGTEIEPGFLVQKTGQRLGSIQMVLSPQEQAELVAAKEEADVLMRQSRTSLQIAEARLERLKQTKGAVAQTRLEELREKVEHARAAYEEAQERLPFLPREPYDDPIQARPVPVEAPLAGAVVSVHARSGQFVVQGDRLWTIADWSVLWVRVPVFELDLPQVDPHQAAEVGVPGTDLRRLAAPVDAAQPTRSGQRTVDRYYELANPDGTLRVGQAVSVLLPTGRSEDRIVVPRSAVLFDGMGDTWVYLETRAHVFRRQRVECGPVFHDGVPIIRGLEEGARVVTVGAEMLFGEEFGETIPVEEDDD